ncbi:hypothetical protein ADIMK_3197 [Marinobacterium lacunae]|uniref:Uncharacterized protein n=1 Tax=Marinobacterium lacunae TaxID=1232683 RepID=A0A081FW20_9GAMM|nr:hypothetical protein ADIMK_3197 [Marinobacterium lacunae]
MPEEIAGVEALIGIIDRALFKGDKELIGLVGGVGVVTHRFSN